jgi:hypothetical protein
MIEANLSFKLASASVILALVTVAMSGCGGCGGAPSNVGHVTGRITLEGQALPDALVTFSPVKEGGTSALGKTDSDGNYTLGYTAGVSGAEIGENKVSISTYNEGNPDSEPPRPAVPEKVPAKYNAKTELKADVKAGNNTFDWDLKKDGPIFAKPPESVERRARPSADGC